MQRFFPLLIALVLLVFQAHGQGSDDQYVRIYNLIQEAEQTESAGQATQALAKYLEARTTLQRFQRSYPDWNAPVVKFRLGFLDSKIAALSSKASPSPAAPVPRSSAPAAAQTQNPADNQLQFYNEQIQRLTADKIVLEAKLKEALASQPASIDPRELAKAEERVKTLQKENDLLKVTLNQTKTQLPAGKNSKSAVPVTAALTESNRKLAEQTERANALELEKNALQKRLDSMVSSQKTTGEIEASRKALDNANRELAEQKKSVSKLTLDKETLENQLRSAKASAETVATMQAENERLKKQLAEAKLSPRKTPKTTGVEKELTQAKTQISALQVDNEKLRLEKVALENRLKQSSSSEVAKRTVEPAPSKNDSAARVNQLEKEREKLQKQLEAALRDASGGKGSAGDKRIEDLENQMTGLRAKLDVFEARRVPYTAEELALFKPPDATLSAAVDLKANKSSIKAPPPGTTKLVAEAQRYFAEKKLDKAEERYLQVLGKDQKNVYTLANLSAIQLEIGHLADAEKHITKAVALAPNDAYSLSILGYLRFRQERYDDALDALSRAAKSEPQNAEIQNYLGLTLGQKGMRGPAETALRKAIQLQPSYGSAHNNLAVVYLAQQPPSIELARWHYQKALAAGHPRNPELEKMLEVKTVAEKGQ
jgi:Flp pilus assembly protein TadD